MKGDDAIRSAPGVTETALAFASEKAAAFVQRLLNHEIAFVEHPENITLAREQRKKPEWQVYRDYVSDKTLRILIQMGMTLRDLAGDPGNFKRIQDLRDKIVSRYGADGLHIAQVVQSGLLGEVFSRALETSTDKEGTSAFIESTLNEADKYCVFIQEDDNAKRRAEEILTRLDENKPQFMYLLSKGNAMDTLVEVAKRLRNKVINYTWSRKEDGSSLFLILSREH